MGGIAEESRYMLANVYKHIISHKVLISNTRHIVDIKTGQIHVSLLSRLLLQKLCDDGGSGWYEVVAGIVVDSGLFAGTFWEISQVHGGSLVLGGVGRVALQVAF